MFVAHAEVVETLESSTNPYEEMMWDSSHSGEGSSGSFKSRFKALWATCGQGCKVIEPWIKPDKRHCNLPQGSCHNSRQAVDIHTISCQDHLYTGHTPEGKAKFTEIVKCMDGKSAITLWQTAGHDHHFHINFPDCYKQVGCRKKKVSN